MLRRHFLLAPAASLAQHSDPPLDLFAEAAREDERAAGAALAELKKRWRTGFACMFVDLLRLPLPPDHPTRRRLVGFLEENTRQLFGHDLHQWQKWIWSQPYEPHAAYGEFKGLVYANIDPRMREFFPPGVASRIRLDRVDWGGVRVNGIPPLVSPAAIPAAEAKYLDDDHVVFGIALNGEQRAYPKRILAWHEMALDRIGGVDLTIVYCTLCGTVIPYLSSAGGRRFRFGTSGLLYESSKLMFDDETKSLWPALEGRPAIGALANSELQLELTSVVTSRWGEWRRRHPGTRVLSLETGHKRDYGEGVAYRDYFSSHKLMFSVSRTDGRLRAKDEVLVVRRKGTAPLAFAALLLASRRVLMHEGLVVLTTAEGANRVYDAAGVEFKTLVGDDGVRDASQAVWQITEDALVAGDKRLHRIPAHRAFWFGWHAQFPATELVK